MITPKYFYDSLHDRGIDFYVGVPDSLLQSFCAYLTDHVAPRNNIIAANEGGAVGLAAGYHLATGRIPVVYMQNSGLGNTVNPLLSLTDTDVYGIPVMLVIGWRGEPGVHDEPQHLKQGKVTLPLLHTMGIAHEILADDETLLSGQLDRALHHMQTTHESYALVVRKGTFADYKLRISALDTCTLEREQAIRLVADAMHEHDVVVSTTGKISRELFEYRAAQGKGHDRDFLTVGSMGHASQIALGIALNCTDRRVYCFDGDGAAIMHLGGLGIVGTMAPSNYVHVVFNNGAHDSVGGQPTIGFDIDLSEIAHACGYKTVVSVATEQALMETLRDLDHCASPTLLEVRVKKGARADLGRPTTTPAQNKEALMCFLQTPIG